MNSQRQTILHIGGAKTGSTYLQNLLALNTDILKQNDLFLPTTGISAKQHRGLANAFGFGYGELNDEQKAETLHQLQNELDQSICKGAVISSEHFDFNPTPSAAEKLAQFFGGQVKVILFLRNQVDFLQSFYAESVKWGATNDFEAFANSILDSEQLNYEKKVAAWKASSVELVVLDYDIVKHNLAASFVTQLGMSSDTTNLRLPTKQSNKSYSPEFIEFARLLNGAKLGRQNSIKIYRGIEKAMRNADPVWRKARAFPMSSQIISRLVKLDESNHRLAIAFDKNPKDFLGGSLRDRCASNEKLNPINFADFMTNVSFSNSRSELTTAFKHLRNFVTRKRKK